ncbi:cellulose biosynthesis protein BcsD [Pantoea coffeiphila]|uniref:Cellulose synthase n=2 Tax=Bacteria TaxID=2 RepID=A0A2S9IA08_9GAMM|nr:cellulose biosynthesis protein BcsD [Pantoea coffeiphila]PRD14629.1 cellulose synthase [Pantoea coffeiphila]
MSQLQDRTLQYYRQQQCQPGWFDLLSVMIGGMMGNAGERESQAFLQQMGDRLAGRYPLGKAATVGDLEKQINQVLARFNWGFIDIQPSDSAMIIEHLALPVADGALPLHQWHLALSAVLTGLYARWLREQGGYDRVSLSVEATSDVSLRFRYKA